jgi:RNA polymerase sigma factor (sigma-70 family)
MPPEPSKVTASHEALDHLVAAARKGNEEALSGLARLARSYVETRASEFTHDPDVHSVLVDATLSAALARLAEAPADSRKSFEQWLSVVTVRQVRSHFRCKGTADELVIRARSGDLEARNQLVEPMRDRLMSHLRCFLEDIETRRDVVQKTLTMVMERIDHAEGCCKGEFEAWVLRRGQNAARTEWRRRDRSRLREAEMDAPETGAAEIASSDPAPEAVVLARAELGEVMKKLDLRQREAVWLTYYHGCTSAETGEILGMKPNTVVQSLRRLQKSLRRKY